MYFSAHFDYTRCQGKWHTGSSIFYPINDLNWKLATIEQKLFFDVKFSPHFYSFICARQADLSCNRHEICPVIDHLLSCQCKIITSKIRFFPARLWMKYENSITKLVYLPECYSLILRSNVNNFPFKFPWASQIETSSQPFPSFKFKIRFENENYNGKQIVQERPEWTQINILKFSFIFIVTKWKWFKKINDCLFFRCIFCLSFNCPARIFILIVTQYPQKFLTTTKFPWWLGGRKNCYQFPISPYRWCLWGTPKVSLYLHKGVVAKRRCKNIHTTNMFFNFILPAFNL